MERGVLKMKILILGGDERQRKLHNLFVQNGYDVTGFTEAYEPEKLNESLQESGTVILPLPVSRDGVYIYSDRKTLEIPLKTVTDELGCNHMLFGGIIRDNLKAQLAQNSVPYFDYYADEAFVSFNAFLTAQCALRLMLENTDEYLMSKRVLITGFGRVAKALAALLKDVGLDVYIAARNDTQKATAYALGYKVLDIYDLSSVIRIFDFTLNTVPHHIIGEREVSLMKDGALYIELASKPYGAKPEYFEKQGKRYLPAASLPGKFCSQSAAEAIYRSVTKRISANGGKSDE